MNQKHFVIFSHGFGVRFDARGMFSDIANSFRPDIIPIQFDYNIPSKDGKELLIRPFQEQVEILEQKIKEIRDKFPDPIIDIVAHSQGCLIVALLLPKNIRKMIMLAPPVSKDINHLVSMFSKRPGTEINFDGISRLARRDGTFSIIPPEYWTQRKQINNPFELYNIVAKDNNLSIVIADEDEVIGSDGGFVTENIAKENVVKIPGNHDFTGEYRSGLVKVVKGILFDI